ncbi:NUDIX hydrolase [Frigidibacter sp. MR17.24]|uniref:NUDIX hydrolase n=1 Tax=Frigidibacter sp. MR17.24 TaxID=3127345 RepID=UPI003012B8EC
MVLPGWDGSDFSGAKLVLLGPDGRLLIYMRDNHRHIPWPGHWDLPGGGREGDETPIACALRELHEEFGIALWLGRIVWHHLRRASPLPGHYFGARITATEIERIRFGDEGQSWRMRPVGDYLRDANTIPHQLAIVRAFADHQRVGTGASPR